MTDRIDDLKMEVVHHMLGLNKSQETTLAGLLALTKLCAGLETRITILEQDKAEENHDG